MWKTFYIQYTHISQFDSFLNQITEKGYQPAYIREKMCLVQQGRNYVPGIEALITTRAPEVVAAKG